VVTGYRFDISPYLPIPRSGRYR